MMCVRYAMLLRKELQERSFRLIAQAEVGEAKFHNGIYQNMEEICEHLDFPKSLDTPNKKQKYFINCCEALGLDLLGKAFYLSAHKLNEVIDNYNNVVHPPTIH